MKKIVFWLASWSVLIFSCTDSNRSEPAEIADLKRQLPNLQPSQALLKITIGDRDFYSENLPFQTNVLLLPQLFKAGFQNSEGSNLEIETIRDDWFEQRPIAFTMTNGTLGESGGDQVILMIGKMIDKLALRGEGYFMVNGKIKIPELNQQLLSIVFEGNLVKPSQASIPENYIPVKGWIVVKEPEFSDQSSADLLKKIDTDFPDK